MTSWNADDQLDACSESFDIAEKNTADDDVDAVLLFADIDFTDPVAVEKRQREWEALFLTKDGTAG